MADFSASALVNGQAIFDESIQKGEWRPPDAASIAMAKKSGFANPALAALRTDESRSVYGYMPIRQASTSQTARAHNHSGARSDSSATAISWSILAEDFSIFKKQSGHNVLSYDQQFAAGLRNGIYNIINRLDAALVAAMVAAKTGYSAGGGKGVFDTTPDVYEVPATEENYFFQNCKQMMNYNLYKGNLVALADDLASMDAERLSVQGSANATNFGFQFAGLEIFKTTETILSGYNGSALLFQSDLVGVVPWIPVENRKPLDPVKAMTYNGDYGQIMVPELGFPIAIHAYNLRADGSSNGGQTQDELLQVEVSIDWGLVTAPLSSFRNAADEVIYACGLLP